MFGPLVVGDVAICQNRKPIEQQIKIGSMPYDQLRGHVYGVKDADAIMLANSPAEIEHLIRKRSSHTAAFEAGDAEEIVSAYLVPEYEEEVPGEKFVELSRKQFNEAIFAADLLWAPDGDAAFDDDATFVSSILVIRYDWWPSNATTRNVGERWS